MEVLGYGSDREVKPDPDSDLTPGVDRRERGQINFFIFFCLKMKKISKLWKGGGSRVAYAPGLIEST